MEGSQKAIQARLACTVTREILAAVQQPQQLKEGQILKPVENLAGQGSVPDVGLRKARKPPRAIDDLIGVQLPLWHDKVRGLPNPIARSSLFTVGNQNQPRQFFKTHRSIVSLAGFTLSFRGEELRQEDEDVFLQLTHLARNHVLGERVEFTAYSILKELGWKRSAEGYARLRLTLDRLQGAGLRVVSDNNSGGYQGALVRKFAWKDDSDTPLSHWAVWLEPEIVKLFGPNGYTQVWWAQRLRLRSALAKYLHGYYGTHEEPYPMKVETLRALTGSRTQRLGDFRKAIRVALEQLVKECFLDRWHIDGNDLVHVVRSPKNKMKALQGTASD